jgi:hypothetical protein
MEDGGWKKRGVAIFHFPPFAFVRLPGQFCFYDRKTVDNFRGSDRLKRVV